MLASVQIINKVLFTKNISIITSNGLTREYFEGYEDEFDYIMDFYKEYKKVPEKITFVDKFKDWELAESLEDDRALVNQAFEYHLFKTTVEEIKKAGNILVGNANEGVNYLRSVMPKLMPRQLVNSNNIIKTVNERVKSWEEKNKTDKSEFIASGFSHLDSHTYGWKKGEEFVVVLARSGKGKTQFLVKTATYCWQQGYNIGFISPEMTANLIGYRFDTSYKGFSNRSLFLGEDIEGYKEYAEKLAKNDTRFEVATPDDFGGKVTVSKLRNFCLTCNIDVLCIDGISYLQDDNYKKGDTPSITFANISQDLMNLSMELGIPVIVVAQSNRDVKQSKDDGEEATATLGNISDSDGIGRKATRVIAIRQVGSGLELALIKNRYGRDNQKIIYKWNADTNEFIYIPQTLEEVQTPTVKTEELGAIF